ncbi:MAG: SAM-dependent chlorinase/fluorinase [Dehalococcoidia bacterium]|nr:SAM-dependent chlorinase/fluorinase [Dehalococcoidia bacterium]
MNNIITLTTDFGIEDYYVGVMKGVILGIDPQARLVDLTHSVGPQQVVQGSFLLGAAFRYSRRGRFIWRW